MRNKRIPLLCNNLSKLLASLYRGVQIRSTLAFGERRIESLWVVQEDLAHGSETIFTEESSTTAFGNVGEAVDDGHGVARGVEELSVPCE